MFADSVFLSNKSIVYFCAWGRGGKGTKLVIFGQLHKCMPPPWFNSFFINKYYKFSNYFYISETILKHILKIIYVNHTHHYISTNTSKRRNIDEIGINTKHEIQKYLFNLKQVSLLEISSFNDLLCKSSGWCLHDRNIVVNRS